MSETTDIAVLEIKPEQAPALYVPNGLDSYLEQIRQQVNEVPDLTTAKGRARVASLAAQVSRSKVAIEKPGRDYLKRLKELPKDVEAELRRWVTECDALRDEVRRPLTEWEADQDRIKAEEQMNAWHAEALVINEAHDKAVADKFESDHEIALFMNEKHDRDAAEAKAEAERHRIAHEEELKRQAVELAKQEAEAAAQREREEAARREADLKAKAEQAESDRIAAEQRAQREAEEARQRAERDKQQAIEDEQRKAREAEQRRLDEEKRIADEKAKREANVKHRKSIGTDIVNGLMANAGLTREQAIATLTALKDNKIPHTSINY